MCGAFFRVESPVADSTDDPLVALFSQTMAVLLCARCRSGFQPVTPPFCLMCGMTSAAFEASDQLCDACTCNPRNFCQARAVGAYEGPLRDLIHDFKFRGRIYLAKPLGFLLAFVLKREYGAILPDILVPVPLHPRKHRLRGFNQTYLLAVHTVRWLQRYPNVADISPGFLHQELLQRSRWTDSQTRQGKTGRKSNIAGAFRVTSPQNIYEKHILVMDDVYTTGSTVDECARVLLAAGAHRVDVLTLARTL